MTTAQIFFLHSRCTASINCIVEVEKQIKYSGGYNLNLLSFRSLLKSHNLYSEILNNEYIERIHQMSYSSLSDNGMLQIFSFLIK